MLLTAVQSLVRLLQPGLNVVLLCLSMTLPSRFLVLFSPCFCLLIQSSIFDISIRELVAKNLRLVFVANMVSRKWKCVWFEIRIQVNNQPKIAENYKFCAYCIYFGVLKKNHFTGPKRLTFQISFLITVHCGIVVALKRTVINDRDEIILRYKMHGVLV